ncbi:unnamed protein product [Sphagnum jensenii]|uniref:Uncharacterized protein n=1 Tax=Sphagnum jensenii TaxID=128206 RepID=A0ABP1AEY5_9BRYO
MRHKGGEDRRADGRRRCICAPFLPPPSLDCVAKSSVAWLVSVQKGMGKFASSLGFLFVWGFCASIFSWMEALVYFRFRRVCILLSYTPCHSRSLDWQ